jgi:hypothetical protein
MRLTPLKTAVILVLLEREYGAFKDHIARTKATLTWYRAVGKTLRDVKKAVGQNTDKIDVELKL